MSSDEPGEKLKEAVEGEFQDFVPNQVGGVVRDQILKHLPNHRMSRGKFNLWLIFLIPIIYSYCFFILYFFVGPFLKINELTPNPPSLNKVVMISVLLILPLGFLYWVIFYLFRCRLNDFGEDVRPLMTGMFVAVPAILFFAGNFYDFFTFLGFIAVIVIWTPIILRCMFKKGTQGSNKYGEEPIF